MSVTKFESLCSAYKAARDIYVSQRENGFLFAQDLVNRYIQFLGVPRACFRFVPTDQAVKGKATKSILGAIHHNDDSYWHMGLQLTLFSAPKGYPEQPILIEFRYKQVAEKVFDVKISSNDPGHRITQEAEADYLAFFEFLQRNIVHYFESGLQQFAGDTPTLKTVGLVHS